MLISAGCATRPDAPPPPPKADDPAADIAPLDEQSKRPCPPAEIGPYADTNFYSALTFGACATGRQMKAVQHVEVLERELGIGVVVK